MEKSELHVSSFWLDKWETKRRNVDEKNQKD